MAKAVIIGKGPAGISAALYLLRAGVEVTILSKGDSALERAEKIENYYGFAQPVSGRELAQAGIEGARRLGCRFVEEEAVAIRNEDGLSVETDGGVYPADAAILATGAARKAPPIPGLKEFEGKGVSYCAVCDGFFFRRKEVAVLGAGEYALHEARELLPLVGAVTLLTNGAPLPEGIPEGLRTETRPLARICGENTVSGVELADGTVLPLAGVFVAEGVASSCDLARKIGAAVDGERILVDERMATNVPGLFAAGDCTGGLRQVCTAVAEGAVAATAVVQYLRKRPEPHGN